MSGSPCRSRVAPAMTVWLHAVVRSLLPLPCAAGLATLYTWGCVAVLEDARFKGRGWVVFGCVIVGLAVLVLGWLGPRLFMKRIPARCPDCGSTMRMAGRPNNNGTLAYHCTACSGNARSPWPMAQFVSGFACAAMGLGAIVLVIVTSIRSPTHDVGAVVVGILIGLVFFCLGAGLAGGRPLWNWIVRVQPWVQRVPWNTVIGGGVALTVGAAFMCVGILSKNTSNMPSGRGPVVIAGLAFFLAGAAILLPALAKMVGGRFRRIAYWIGTGIGFTLLLCFAAVPILIAINNHRRDTFELGPFLSAGTVIAPMIVIIYVAIRDRKGKQNTTNCCENAAETSSITTNQDSAEKKDVGKGRRLLLHILWFFRRR